MDRVADKLVVQKFIKDHNHEVDGELFKLYPEQRRLSDNQRKDVEVKLGLGVKVNVLQKHVEQLTGKTVTTKDLHNIRQSMRLQATGTKSESEVLIERLDELGNVIL